MAEVWLDFWQEYFNFFPLQSVWTNSQILEALPVTCSVGTKGTFPGLKRPEHEAEKTSPPNAEVKN